MTDISARLRTETGEAHCRLEQVLALLSPPPSQARTRRALERFRGFHATWEPALQGRADMAAITHGRSRLTLLDGDLQRLGLTAAAIAALPACRAAAGLCSTPGAALGSLYVMEGSTLGGQVIARGLAGAPWLPGGGLSYFSPYGERTGRMWRELKTYLQTAADGGEGDAIVAGAVSSFGVLQAWLACQ